MAEIVRFKTSSGTPTLGLAGRNHSPPCMALLSSITLENFRTFRRRTTLDLAPLTLLTGPNSSGKSSVLKALQLLQHNAALGRLHRPTFAGGNHNLGSFENVRSRGSDRSAITLGLSFDWGDWESGETLWTGHDGSNHHSEFEVGDINVEFVYQDVREVLSNMGLEDDEMQDFKDLNYQLGQVRLGTQKGGRRPLFEIGVHHEVLTHPTRRIAGYTHYYYAAVLHGDWFFEDADDAYQAFGFPPDRPAAAVEAARWISQPLRFEVKALDVLDDAPSLERLVVAACSPKEWTHVSSNGEPVAHPANNPFLAFALDELIQPYLLRWTRYLSEQIAELDHTGAFRATPRRLYPDAENDPFTRLLYAHTRPPRENSPSVASEPKVDLLPGLLQTYGLGDDLKVERVADAAYSVQVLRGGHAVHLADLGYGYTQLLPLLLYAVHVHGVKDWQPTLLVEEPEANLHPNLQARLADLFVQLTEPLSGHALVETHSEYLVRRLQYLVAKGVADADRVAVYYVGADPDADDYVRRITISPQGRLSEEFGPGFLDEATSLMISLFKYGSEN